MPLQSQDVPIALGQGVDTKTDPKQVEGKLLTLQNGTFQVGKRISKRYGYGVLTQTINGGGSISQGAGLCTFKNEINILDGTSLYSYSSALNQQINKGQLIPIDVSITPVVRNLDSQSQPDSSYHSGTGLQAFCWINTNGSTTSGTTTTTTTLNYSIFDAVSGACIVNDAVLSSAGVKVKVLTLAQYFVFIYYTTSGTKLAYKVVDTGTPTALGTETTIATDIYTTLPFFDATVINGSIYIVYGKTGLTQIAFYSLSSTLVLSSPFAVTVGQINPAITIKGDASNNVWAAWGLFGGGPAGNVFAVAVNSALNSTVLAKTTVFALVNIQNISMTISGTTATIYVEGINGSFTNFVDKNTVTIGGAVGTSSRVLMGVGLSSKVFTSGGVDYFLANYSGFFQPVSIHLGVYTTIQPTLFLVNSSGKVLAKLAPGVAGRYYITGLLPEVTNVTGQVFQIPYLQQGDLSAANGEIFFKLGVMKAIFDLQPTQAPAKLVMGNNLLIGSGQTWMYDGAQVVEHGFHLTPESLVPNITTSGGGIGIGVSTATINQVSYIAVFEWSDNQGQLHRSGTSPAYAQILVPHGSVTAVTFTATTTKDTNSVTPSSFTGLFLGQVISCANFPAGTFISDINGTSFITLSTNATATGAGVSFTTYDVCQIQVRVPTLHVTLKNNVSIALYRTTCNGTIYYRVTSLTNLTFNDPTTDVVTIVDTLGDGAITGNEQLYITGGEVDNGAPPALSAMCAYKNRAVYFPTENRNQFGFSKQVIPGVPVEFSPLLFVQNVDSNGGDLVCGQQMDDKLILFKSNKIFLTAGDGPTPAGTNNDLIEPQLLATDTGCNNPASVVLTPLGIMYQSPKGIYLLDRSLQNQYIGAEVEAFNSFTVTSALLIESQNQVRFTLSSGMALVYDYFYNQWSAFTNHSAVDAVLYNHNYTMLSAAGVVSEQTTTFDDNGSVIPLSLKTGWLNFAGLQNFMRVREMIIVGAYKSPHTLSVNIYTDFGTSPTQTITIPVLVDPGLYQYKIAMKIQKCETVQIEIIETQSGSVGEGLNLSGLAFRVGVKAGFNNVKDSQSY